MGFNEPLSNLKVQALRDLCWNLQLDEQGTKEVLKARALAHFESNPELRDSAKYTALFPSRSKRRRPVAPSSPTSPALSAQPAASPASPPPSPTNRRRLHYSPPLHDVTNETRPRPLPRMLFSGASRPSSSTNHLPSVSFMPSLPNIRSPRRTSSLPLPAPAQLPPMSFMPLQPPFQMNHQPSPFMYHPGSAFPQSFFAPAPDTNELPPGPRNVL